MLELTALPARQGDALWIRWGAEDAPHQMLVDMGTLSTGTLIRQRLDALPQAQRGFDLLVVTHVDSDHIGGVLTALAEAPPLPGLTFADVWFNGFEHLSGGTTARRPELEPMGPAQGEKLSDWLRHQPWNEAFGRGPVQRKPGSPAPSVTLHDGLRLTVLGPTPQRLADFIPTWSAEVAKALAKGTLDPAIVAPGLEPMGSSQPPLLMSLADLQQLADADNRRDTSAANGSSIALLLEYRGRTLLLAGDAFSSDLASAIAEVRPDRRLHLDTFKLPHHGSKKNVHRELVQAVDCDLWLVSSDGTSHRHPDAEAIARVIRYSTQERPLLMFNVPSTFNGWWQRAAWRNRYHYDVDYGDAESGLTLAYELD